MVEMSIYGVSFDLVGKQPIVLLKTAEGNRYLPIWIGHPEAAAILMKLQGATAPRPLTHDLLVNILNELEVEVVRVTVTELRENTFHASITVLHERRRGRDRLPLVGRDRGRRPGAGADLRGGRGDRGVGDRVRGRGATRRTIVDEFKKFLDRVSAEDFAEAEVEEEEDD